MALTVLFACPGFGQTPPSTSPASWKLFAFTRKGEYHGVPVCRDVKFFTGSPFNFDYGNDLFNEKPKDVHVSTEVTPIGVINGRQIMQIVQNINNGELVMKRLLVQRDGEEFCAIYQQQYAAPEVQIKTATIEDVPGGPVLATKDGVGNHGYLPAFWVFDDNGPIPLDLDILTNAMNKLLPPGYEVRGDYGLDMHSLCYQSLVWRKNECNACASGGTVFVRFALQDHRLIVLQRAYDPTGAPNTDACSP